MKILANRFSFSRLSIRLRLQLLICALLLAAIAVYGFANYYSLRKATLALARERLNSITAQVSSTFGVSAAFVAKTVNNASHQTPVMGFLQAGGDSFRLQALDILNKLHRDSTWVSVELLDAALRPVLLSAKSILNAEADMQSIMAIVRPGLDTGKVGNIYNIKGSVYYPIISTVTSANQVKGYIIAWISLRATPQTLAEFSQFVGTGASFYVGNKDGSLWTDLLKPLAGAPFKTGKAGNIVEFADEEGNNLIAGWQYVAHTNWLVAIAFSEKTLLKGVTGFVKWIIIIGAVLTGVGILAAWVTSRNITRPLNQLTTAVTGIAEGNYASSVSPEMYNSSETVKLAKAFNIMAAEVYKMHEGLEAKVEERTLQMERINQELEAFSYSVSHDLRAPLRAISGYSVMLKEDYEAKLDADGNRIINTIITNAKMMGQLIDDLLTFSRLGKKELIVTTVDMTLLAITVVNELLLQKPVNKYRINIGALPPAQADPGMIKQVLVNLAGNAIKYSSKKENPIIEMGFKDEQSKTIYYVKDNGAGFDAAYAHKLFGVFQRLHSQDEFEGSGVGLALVKRIIERHKGEIWAEGREGAGATFYFSLPKA